MAVLTLAQCDVLMRQVAGSGISITYTKPQILLALQTIENWFEANRAALGSAINAGTAPFVFTASQKTALVKYWLLQKAGRE